VTLTTNSTILRRGSDAVVDVLRSENVPYVFGNPGTTELPLLEALAETPDIHYVLALQEATAVGIADGYAQATGRPGVVNLHTLGGLANGIGNLANARATNVPMVVTAGQQDLRDLIGDPVLSGDLTGLARTVAKWTYEVRRRDEIGTILRRAFHDAVSPPAGPVFVSLPMNLLEEVGEVHTPERSTLDRRAVGGGIVDLADELLRVAAGRLAIVVDMLATSGVTGALIDLAEATGARVFGAAWGSTNAFPTAHPLWAGGLPSTAAEIRSMLAGFERLLLVGGNMFRTILYSPGSPLPDGVDVLHLSPDPLQLGRTYPTRLGVLGDPAATLEAILPRVRANADAKGARHVIEQARADRAQRSVARQREVDSRSGAWPVAPIVAAHALVQALPRDAIIVDEAPVIMAHIRVFREVDRPGRYFGVRGGGLGWGMPAALGVSLGAGREPVLCTIGDGSAMYAPQALWTAAREHLPVIFAVLNNREYDILRKSELVLDRTGGGNGQAVGLDLAEPPMRFTDLARAHGVAATSIERLTDVGDVLRSVWPSGEPHLLEIPLARD
jgi:benzoylformate decarboxylase